MESVRVAEMAAITGSTFLSGRPHFTNVHCQHKTPGRAESLDIGALCSLSLSTMPVLLETSDPNALARQWKSIFLRGRVQGPTIAAISGLLYGYVAYARSQAGESGQLQVTAALATVAIAPYTAALMARVNQKLLTLAAAEPASSTAKSEGVRDLVIRWTRLNLIRGLFPLLGGVLGLWGALNRG